jgi:hypothetical protein
MILLYVFDAILMQFLTQLIRHHDVAFVFNVLQVILVGDLTFYYFLLAMIEDMQKTKG